MKRVFTFLVAVLLTASMFAQSPQKMSYQAVVRDVGNSLVTTQISIRITLIRGPLTPGTDVYIERQIATPNNNGLVTIEINGLSAIHDFGTFESIDWSTGSYYIKTETDVDPGDGSNYSITGTSQLLSVPYALQAKNTENYLGTITESQISDLQSYIITETDGSITNEIQDLSLTDNILKITNNISATEIDISNLTITKDWCFLKFASSQTTDISAGNPIKFDIAEGNMSLSNYKITLHAGKTYELSANLLCIFSETYGRLDYYWYDITDNIVVGSYASLHNNFTSYNYNPQSTALCIIKPLIDIEVELRILIAAGITSLDKDYSFAAIKEL